jgi:hypothetical protein
MQARFVALVMLGMLGCTRRPPLPRGASWDSRSATLTWSRGEVKLPRGFSYEPDYGTDSFEGHFASSDDRVVIHHDIGGYAGCWASREGALSFSEASRDGFRILRSKRAWPNGSGAHTFLVAVTFP